MTVSQRTGLSALSGRLAHRPYAQLGGFSQLCRHQRESTTRRPKRCHDGPQTGPRPGRAAGAVGGRRLVATKPTDHRTDLRLRTVASRPRGSRGPGGADHFAGRPPRRPAERSREGSAHRAVSGSERRRDPPPPPLTSNRYKRTTLPQLRVAPGQPSTSCCTHAQRDSSLTRRSANGVPR